MEELFSSRTPHVPNLQAMESPQLLYQWRP